MNLQPRYDSISAQKEFLKTTQALVWKVGALTLKAGAFTPDATGRLKAGSAVVIEDASDLAVPYVDDATTPGTVYITANDVKLDANVNVIVGGLEEAYLDKRVVQKAEAGRVVASDAFITASNGRFKLR